MYVGEGTITRRMESVLDDLQDEFRSLYDKGDFQRALNAVKEAGTRSDRPSKLRKLCDMLDACGIPYEWGRDNAYYEELVKSIDGSKLLPAEDRMLLALFARYQKYPSPEDYMKRIVDRLCCAEDGWKNDTLRLRILKQFIKYGNYLDDAGFGGRMLIRNYVKDKIGKKPSEEDVLKLLDDGVFSGLNEADKSQKKQEGKYGLLKVADDLATGQFRGEGATKKSLYLFAMVYGMTYYSGGDDGEILDYATDVETNLFRDYYTNNLMRYISRAYKGKLCEYELDPSGQGINYKNFAEMIYIYYIAQDCTPQEKIKRSGEMIRRVQSSRFKKERVQTEPADGTVFYRNLYSDDILRLPEQEFEQFICENYDCDTYAGSYETKNGTVDAKVGVMQLEKEQNSAFQAYREIIQDLKDLIRKENEIAQDQNYPIMTMENCNYGLWFIDVGALGKEECAERYDFVAQLDRGKFQEFTQLLYGINSFMGYTAEEKATKNEQEHKELSKRKTKALYVPSADAVTRTSMIVAYYYYYNALHEQDGRRRWQSFEDVFYDFKRGIDKKLEEAYYQPLSGKNIFDVLVVFSSYAYLNL